MSDAPSPWNHNCCLSCWTAMRGDQVPVRLIGAPPDACCWCGTANDAGIYIRSDPKRLRCYGDHRARAG